jgi:hypothetical protein
LLRKLAAAFAAALVATPAPAATVCADCVRADMQILTSDALAGRRCGAEGEHAAAQLIAGRLRSAGVPGALAGGYLQPVELRTPAYATPPALEVSGAGGAVRFAAGADFAPGGASASFEGPLVFASRVGAGPLDVTGKIVVYDQPGVSPRDAGSRFTGRPLASLAVAPEGFLPRWSNLAERPPGETEVVGGDPGPPRGSGPPLLFLKPEALQRLLAAQADAARLTVQLGPPRVRTTYNVLGVIHGTDPDADRQALLLSAHYDHLGVRDGRIYRGANDDASGTAAVLEFARILGGQAPPKRTVYFALFGCEEEGGLGSRYYLAHPPAPLTDLAVNLEFEMIGARDPNRPQTLMLTGWERSNLGPTLAAEGARIGPDPYPEQQFFRRSDNYFLARKGVVAQTISAWPLPPTYHTADDDLAHLDLDFMIEVVGSLVAPIERLLGNGFRPAWNPGQQP